MRVDKKIWYSPWNCKRACNHTIAANREKHNEVIWVSYCNIHSVYKASICVNSRRICLWSYHNFQDATDARRDAEMQYLWKYVEYDSSDEI